MAPSLDWNLIRAFLAVLRRGSLSAAARELGLTQPTIGRHIEELETGLGAALFTRSPGGLLPTETALALLPHAEVMEKSFEALVRAAAVGGSEDQPRGTVRISASEVMGTFVLPPILADLRDRAPGLTFELVLNNRTDDLLRRDADIAVRMTRPKQEGLVARKAGTVPLGLYAHHRYVERFGSPATLEDLLRHHVIGFDRDDHSARSVAGGRLPISRAIFSLRVDSDAAQVMAIRAGLGIGMMQKPLARLEPLLLPVLEREVAIDLECWIAVHEDQRAVLPVRTVLDALVTGLASWTATPSR